MALARWNPLSTSLQDLFDGGPEARTRTRKRIGAFLLLTLLWHLLLFLVPWSSWLPRLDFIPPPRVALDSISPEKLNEIRKSWREKSLLLAKDKTPETQEAAPKDSRYISDRNRTVERETRARKADTLPQSASRTASPSQLEKKTKTQPIPLRNLGIPFNKRVPSRESAPEVPNEGVDREASDQLLSDPNLSYGAENMLNTEQSLYYSFYARMYEAVAPVWQSKIREVPVGRRVPPGDYQTQVDVVFDEEGNFLKVNYHHRAGVPEFDNAVEYSWKKIERVPNPPQDLLDEKRQVHTGWTFTVHVGEESGVQYLPPSRAY